MHFRVVLIVYDIPTVQMRSNVKLVDLFAQELLYKCIFKDFIITIPLLALRVASLVAMTLEIKL